MCVCAGGTGGGEKSGLERKRVEKRGVSCLSLSRASSLSRKKRKERRKNSLFSPSLFSLTWFRYQKSSTGLPLTRTSLRDPFGRSSGLRTGTQLDEEEASAAAAEEEAAATVVVVVAGVREGVDFFLVLKVSGGFDLLSSRRCCFPPFSSSSWFQYCSPLRQIRNGDALSLSRRNPEKERSPHQAQRGK